VTGVQVGAQVVTDGFDKLQSGTKIVVKLAQGAAAAEPSTTPPPAH
jgi:hypothetical protein